MPSNADSPKLPSDDALETTSNNGAGPEWDDEAGVIEVPFQQSSEDALLGLLEEYVSRDGTDYGDVEASLQVKTQQVRNMLQSGKAIILFDPLQQSCHIVDKAQYKAGC